MATATPSRWTTHRGRVAALSRSRSADDPDLIAARAELRTAHFLDHVERVVADAPPLSAEQRERLAALLRGGGGDAAA